MSCPPRIEVVPPAAKSAGQVVAALAGKAGIVLDDAQRRILSAFCGTAPDGRWAAFEAAVLQPRQNGKTEALIARILGALFITGEQEVLFSAHQSRTTGAVFRRLKRAIEGTPELGGKIGRISNRIGAEVIELESGARLECVARGSGSGRGFTGDLIVLDEAQYLTAQQMEDVLPTLAARPNGQILYAMSRGTEESGHLGALRARALARRPGDRVAWLEWSLGEADRVDDRQTWVRCNPAYPARISMEYMEDEFRALGPDGFAKERLGRSSWPVDSFGRFAVFSKEAWEGCEAPGVSTEGSGVSLGVATSRLGDSAAVVACSSAPGGMLVLEVLGHRPGQRGGWVAPFIRDLASRHRIAPVVWNDETAARELGLAMCGVRPETPGPGEFPKACMTFLRLVEDHAVMHLGQAELTLAAGGAVARNTRDGWYFSADPFGAEVLTAAAWALYGCRTRTPPYDLVKSVA